MRIQPQQNVNANRTAGAAKAGEPAFKTQSIAPGGLAPEAAQVMGRDRIALAPPQMVIISGPAQPAAHAQPAQAPAAGPDWGGVVAWIFNPFKLQTAIGAVGQAIGQAVAGAIQGAASGLGGLFKGPEPQPARPVEVPVRVIAAEPAVEAPRDDSRERIAGLMAEVWGTAALFNESSYAWWKGQLKLVNGDYDRLQEVMVAYKKSIERA